MEQEEEHTHECRVCYNEFFDAELNEEGGDLYCGDCYREHFHKDDTEEETEEDEPMNLNDENAN
jgi:hypothetical protein